MFDLIVTGGPYMYFLVFFAIIIIGLAIKKAIDLFGQQERSVSQMETGINAIVFWGGISLLIGFFAHFYGLYIAMQAISQANDISPAIVAEGYGVSLITILVYFSWHVDWHFLSIFNNRKQKHPSIVLLKKMYVKPK